MAMTDLQVFEQVARPVLAESLGLTPWEVWTVCTLAKLGVNEPTDLADIAWRLKRRVSELGFAIGVDRGELTEEMTVADVVTLVGRKLDALEVPASVVVQS